jgi:hypothetical protein
MAGFWNAVASLGFCKAHISENSLAINMCCFILKEIGIWSDQIPFYKIISTNEILK